MTRHRYLAFGLRVECAWPISSFAVSELPFSGGPDVEIDEADISPPEDAQEVGGAKVRVDGAKGFLEIPDCGRFEIVGGRRILVQPNPGVTRDQVNLYLLGSVFGMLLHQRLLLPFHCNAVEIEGSAFLFCGESGAGKSTLAAYFVERGFRLLSDDLCALHFDERGRLVVFPGAPRLKLWQDTLDAFGRSSDGLALVPWYDDKFEMPLPQDKWGEPLPVAGIFHLRTADSDLDHGIHRLKGLEAANCITANIYRRRLADLIGAGHFYLTTTARIVEQVPVFTMNRHWGFAHFHEEAAAAEDRMRELVARGGEPAASNTHCDPSGPSARP